MNNILGGLGFFDEGETEKENPIKGVIEAIVDLGKNILPFKGTIEFAKTNKINKSDEEKERKEKADAKIKEIFFQALKEDMIRARDAKEKLLSEEEIYDIITNLPTVQKNEMLHYQASYKDRSIYQKAALRRKLIEMQKKQEKKEKEASIPNPAKRANALETAFEGGSGNQGGGTSNLSNQAVG